MKTIEIQLFKFDELSDEAKETAINKWRDSNNDFSFTLCEISESLEKFAAEFNVNIRDYSLGYNSNIDARLGRIDDTILDLKGARLFTYLSNNYGDLLTERKGYGKYEKKANGKFDYKRRSKVFFTDTCCPLTGVCFDEDLLSPIRQFLQRPGNDTYESLLRDCISECEKTAESAIEYENSDACITENIQSNDYDFTADGIMY